MGRSGRGWVYVYERGRAPLDSGVAGKRGSRSTLSRVGKFDNLGEVPAAVGMVLSVAGEGVPCSLRSPRSVAPAKRRGRPTPD